MLLPGLSQFLAPENHLKPLFHLKSTLFLKYLIFCPNIFGHVGNRLDDKVNFKIYDVIYWDTNNCNIHIAQYLKN